MAAKMMPGGPVADAVFADLVPAQREARRQRAHAGPRHHPRRRRRRQRALRRHEDGEGARARLVGTAPAPARERDPGRRARRGEGLQRRPARRRLPHPAPDAAAHRLRRRAARDGSRQGRRRHAPGQHGSPGADDARSGARAPRPASRRSSRSTRSRSPATRSASSAAAPRSVARSRCCCRRSGRRPTPRSPWCTPACPTGPSTRAGPASSSPPPACPGILQPEHISPGAVVVGGGVRYEGRRLLPDVDEACEEVAGAITPRVGGVGPTTIAMLFRNAVEAAERDDAARRQSGTV